jgi:hypothetical protein
MCVDLEDEHDECLPVVAFREVDGHLVPVRHRPSAGGELIERRDLPRDEDRDEVVA